jgi:hypothetical protein
MMFNNYLDWHYFLSSSSFFYKFSSSQPEKDVGPDCAIHPIAVLDARLSRGCKASPACFWRWRIPSIPRLYDVNPVLVSSKEQT